MSADVETFPISVADDHRPESAAAKIDFTGLARCVVHLLRACDSHSLRLERAKSPLGALLQKLVVHASDDTTSLAHMLEAAQDLVVDHSDFASIVDALILHAFRTCGDRRLMADFACQSRLPTGAVTTSFVRRAPAVSSAPTSAAAAVAHTTNDQLRDALCGELGVVRLPTCALMRTHGHVYERHQLYRDCTLGEGRTYRLVAACIVPDNQIENVQVLTFPFATQKWVLRNSHTERELSGDGEAWDVMTSAPMALLAYERVTPEHEPLLDDTSDTSAVPARKPAVSLGKPHPDVDVVYHTLSSPALSEDQDQTVRSLATHHDVALHVPTAAAAAALADAPAEGLESGVQVHADASAADETVADAAEIAPALDSAALRAESRAPGHAAPATVESVTSDNTAARNDAADNAAEKPRDLLEFAVSDPVPVAGLESAAEAAAAAAVPRAGGAETLRERPRTAASAGADGSRKSRSTAASPGAHAKKEAPAASHAPASRPGKSLSGMEIAVLVGAATVLLLLAKSVFAAAV